MSTKTTIKRIALVAVSALGFGMLSVVPSQAVAGVPTLTTGTGSASVTTGQANETTTAATVSIVGLLTAATDSYSVQVLLKSRPSTASSVSFRVAYMETSTASTTYVAQAANTATSLGLSGANRSTVTAYDSTTADASGTYWLYGNNGTNYVAGYVGAKFGIMVDSQAVSTRVVGTYVYTAIVTPYSNGTAGTPVTADLTFTINDTAANTALASGTIDPSKTTAVLNEGSLTTSSTTWTSTDSSVVKVATAAATNHASIRVRTYTSTSLPAPESVTVTITGAGVICDGSSPAICGSNLTLVGTGGDNVLYVRANGTAGVASIVVKTTTKTFPAKTVTFFAKAPSTITVTSNKPVISVAAASAQTDVVRAVAKDASGNNWAGTLYIAADGATDALIAGNVPSSTSAAVACTYDSTYGFHSCPLKGTAAGTAKVKVFDATNDADGVVTTADAAVTSATTSVRVSTGSATTVKMIFDKATYAPGEKAYLWVKVLDENGLDMPAGTYANVFAANPAVNPALSSGGQAPNSTSVVISGYTDAASDLNAGAQTWIVYMPQATGTVTFTATGSTGLAAAGRVAVSASAEVVNESVNSAVDAANEATDAANAATDAANAAAEAADAATAAAQDAQAAVAALATQVASLIAGIKAQITSLTNLVIKIQKKVKA